MRWLGVSGLPEDVYENILYYDTAGDAAAWEACADALVQGFLNWGYHAGINGAEVRVYLPTGGQPLWSKAYSYVKSSQTGPGEVAVCLSYAASEDWEASVARRRGRIFLGPLIGSQTNVDRPGTTIQADTIALGQLLAQPVPASTAYQWMLWSTTDQVGALIRSISFDNAWDTQRRRGLSPTTRQVVSL